MNVSETRKSFLWPDLSTLVHMPVDTSVHRLGQHTSRSLSFSQTLFMSLESANTALTIAHLRTVDIQLDSIKNRTYIFQPFL